MENLTHSLVGAALAELALPAAATPLQRRVFFVAGIVAANLPDADLLYTRISPAPLGYLLHHRGHTHTVVGVLALALLMGAPLLLPWIRRRVGSLGPRLWALVGVSLLSHLVLDSWNSYGVHPFWPIDARWYYGDAIYIVEPWFWVLLGVAASLNARSRRGGVLLGAALTALAGLLVRLGMMPVGALAALAAAAVALVVVSRAWTAHRRSAVALALSAAFVAAMFGLRERVDDAVLAALASAARGQVADVVLSPRAANPLCWNVLAIVSDEGAGEYVMTRGTAAPVVAWGCGAKQGTGVAWEKPARQSLALLRELNRRDCSVRAWLQFGRAPEIDGRTISDLRFGGTARANFSTMPLGAGEEGACPPNLTRWGIPRADLLGSASTGALSSR